MEKLSVVVLIGVLCFPMFQFVHFPISQSEANYMSMVQGDSTVVSGYIFENTTWAREGSPYIVVSDTVLEFGAFLTIELGVIVEFYANQSLIVHGSVIAEGNSTNPVLFTSAATIPESGDWGSIDIRSDGSWKSVRHVIVEYSTEGIKGLADSGISQSVFFRNIVGVSGSRVNITFCSFEDNGLGATVTDALLSNSEFYNNTNGINLSGTMRDCQVNWNEVTGILGSGTIENTTVSHNGGNGVEAYIIRNCSVSNNNGDGANANQIYDSIIQDNGGLGTKAIHVYNSIFRNNVGGGALVHSEFEEDGMFSHSNASDNLSGGVFTSCAPTGGGFVLVEYSQVSGNQFGIGVSPNFGASVEMSHCTISQNPEGGIIISPSQVDGNTEPGVNLNVHDSAIFGNGEFGIATNFTVSHHGFPGGAWGTVQELSNCEISNHTVGALSVFGVVSGNTIFGNEVGLNVTTAVGAISGNNISNNRIGLTIMEGSGHVSYNSINKNGIGIDTSTVLTPIDRNNIHDNEIYNVRTNLPFPIDVNATSNWWGTTNRTEIENYIYDYYDNASLGKVLVNPILIEPVETNGTVYIRADGSIDPAIAPISTMDGFTYVLTDSINGSIVIEKSNVVVDGAGYAVTGNGTGIGILFQGEGESQNPPAVNVTVKNVNVQGFDVGFSFGDFYASNDSVANSNITNNRVGVSYGSGTENDNVTGCSIVNNGKGIYGNADPGLSGFVSENNITANNGTGIDAGAYRGANLVIFDNTIEGNGGGGIALGFRARFDIYSNDISGNVGYGISVSIYASANIYSNNITGSPSGIIHFGEDAYVYGNNITNNFCGIIGFFGGGSFYHNNFIGNVVQVNQTYTYGPNWDDGYPSGGNFWDDYGGVDEYSGVNQSQAGHDGIGDTPYVVHLDQYQTSADRYPLIRPWGQDSSIPVATFTYSPVQPLVGEEIAFNASTSYDLDGFITNYTWNFGDGSEISGLDEVPSHSYSKAEIYNVTLIVMDNSSLSTLKTRQIAVGKIPSEISLSANPTELNVGGQTVLSGSIYPSRPDSNVTIWFRLNGESTWQALVDIRTDETSQYVYNWIPPAVGIYSLKGNWTGDETTLPAESSSVTLNCVKIVTSISISTDCSSTIVGFGVNVTGMLADEYGNALKNENVVLYYTFGGLGTWAPITSDITDNHGNYFVTWIPTATGYFTIKVEWAGNATHLGASSTVALSTLPYQNQYVFTVESNSTISDLTFNSNSNKLSFVADGENGTTGYTRVTIAKSLIMDVTKIKVLVDGLEYNYTVTELNDSWVLLFTYDHSVHQVEVDLQAAIPEFPSFLMVALFMIGTVLAVIAYKKRAKSNSQVIKSTLAL